MTTFYNRTVTVDLKIFFGTKYSLNRARVQLKTFWIVDCLRAAIHSDTSGNSLLKVWLYCQRGKNSHYVMTFLA